MNNEFYIILIPAIFSFVISVGTLILAWRKARPETQHVEAETHSSQADAAETALKSTQLATDQLIRVQVDLADERSKRIEQGRKIDHLENEIEKLTMRIRRLEAQVVSLGAEPVK